MKKEMAQILGQVREKAPLVQAITNYVTIGDCANILLAFGASPAMCEAVDEAYAFAGISGAVYINLGTLTKEQEAASLQASLGAKAAGVPVILDPAGCGAIPRKITVLEHLHRNGRIDLIKGNMGEIKTLAGMPSQVKGVDSLGEEPDIDEAVTLLAKRYGCTVAATGRVDVLSDGQRLVRIQNGVELLTKITGAGCMLGALCAATAAVCPDMLSAAATAITAMGIAGEMAFEKAKLPGSFRVALMDSIYLLDGSILMERGKCIC